MPPKKQKEKILTLEDLQAMAGATGGSGSWADDEAELSTPAFQTVSQPSAVGGSGMGSWSSGGGAGPRGNFGPAPVAPIPDQPPYTARIGNVSYDVNESHLEDFFAGQHNLKIESLRLPRGPDGQIKGAAYIDFADRDSLVSAMKLGGSQILGRTVSVNVAEQRGPPTGFGAGPGMEFDWGKREDPNELFGRGPPPVGGDNDRLSRFRQRSTMQEPELDWSARSGPMGGAGRPPRQPEPELDWSARSGPISSRAPRQPEPELDWSSRLGPRAARAPRQPEPELDWSSRQGPRPPRQPSQPEPEIDWSARSGPIAARSGFAPRGGANSHRRKPSAEAEMNWSQRGVPVQRRGNSKPASASPTPAASAPVQDKKQSSESNRIAKLQQGFKALQLDDEDKE